MREIFQDYPDGPNVVTKVYKRDAGRSVRRYDQGSRRSESEGGLKMLDTGW